MSLKSSFKANPKPHRTTKRLIETVELLEKEDKQKYEDLEKYYIQHFDEYFGYLNCDEPEKLSKSLKFFLHYLQLAKDDTYAKNILQVDILDRLFTLFASMSSPIITLDTLNLLSLLSYWVDITINPSQYNTLIDTCIQLFSSNDPSFFESLLVFIGNFSLSNDGFSALFIQNQGIIHSDNIFYTHNLHNIDYLLRLCYWMVLQLVQRPFDLEEIYQITILVEKSFENKDIKCILYSFKIIQTLMKADVDYPFSEQLVFYFIASTASTTEVIKELLKTILMISNQDLYRMIINDDFINNLALQIIKVNGKDTIKRKKSSFIAKDTFHFLNEIFPFFVPDVNNIILIAAMLSIAEGAYEERKEALTFVYKLCNNDREFTIGICAAGLLLPLANVIDTEMSDVSMMCLEILYMLGMACEEMAIDLTQCQGYEIIAKVLDKLLGVPESDEMNERIYDLLRYYYLDDENV